eukprot:IDg12354t1
MACTSSLSQDMADDGRASTLAASTMKPTALAANGENDREGPEKTKMNLDCRAGSGSGG